jgi:L-alanine-DL-glutamate epimerase-like enolase superfamily enzyme
VSMIRRLCEFGIYFAEQPVPPGDVNRLTEVRRQVSIPILADESVYSPADALAIVRAEAADALSVYVGKAGGIGSARKVSVIAEAAMLGCTIGSNLELGIGTAAMIHLALAAPGITAAEYPCDIIGPFFYTGDILTRPLPLCGGKALPLEGPGLGVELDEEQVNRYRVI